MCASRRLVISAILAASCTLPSAPTFALQVAERSEEERVGRALYAAPAPEIQSYASQVDAAISIKSMRGVWILKESYDDRNKVGTTGRLFFRGAEMEQKGTVAYEGENTAGRGPWIIKPDGFGRSPRGVGGVIEQKALWKLRRSGAGVFTYAGRVNVGASRMDARVEGDIIELLNGGKPKGGSERRVGTFVATLERKLTAAEETASTDSASAGGAAQALQVTTVMDERLVYK